MVRNDPMPERSDLQLIPFDMHQLQLPELLVTIQEPDDTGIRVPALLQHGMRLSAQIGQLDGIRTRQAFEFHIGTVIHGFRCLIQPDDKVTKEIPGLFTVLRNRLFIHAGPELRIALGRRQLRFGEVDEDCVFTGSPHVPGGRMTGRKE